MPVILFLAEMVAVHAAAIVAAIRVGQVVARSWAPLAGAAAAQATVLAVATRRGYNAYRTAQSAAYAARMRTMLSAGSQMAKVSRGRGLMWSTLGGLSGYFAPRLIDAYTAWLAARDTLSYTIGTVALEKLVALMGKAASSKELRDLLDAVATGAMNGQEAAVRLGELARAGKVKLTPQEVAFWDRLAGCYPGTVATRKPSENQETRVLKAEAAAVTQILQDLRTLVERAEGDPQLQQERKAIEALSLNELRERIKSIESRPTLQARLPAWVSTLTEDMYELASGRQDRARAIPRERWLLEAKLHVYNTLLRIDFVEHEIRPERLRSLRYQSPNNPLIR